MSKIIINTIVSINFLKINPKYRRTIIFTDSLHNFIPLITTPNKNLKLAYKDLLNNTRTYIMHNHMYLWKVKSHTKPITQPLNKCADILADRERKNPINDPTIIPTFNIKNIKYSQFTTIGSSTNVFDSLAEKLSLAASMEFELQPD
eukprot:338053_1